MRAVRTVPPECAKLEVELAKLGPLCGRVLGQLLEARGQRLLTRPGPAEYAIGLGEIALALAQRREPGVEPLLGGRLLLLERLQLPPGLIERAVERGQLALARAERLHALIERGRGSTDALAQAGEVTRRGALPLQGLLELGALAAQLVAFAADRLDPPGELGTLRGEARLLPVVARLDRGVHGPAGEGQEGHERGDDEVGARRHHAVPVTVARCASRGVRPFLMPLCGVSVPGLVPAASRGAAANAGCGPSRRGEVRTQAGWRRRGHRSTCQPVCRDEVRWPRRRRGRARRNRDNRSYANRVAGREPGLGAAASGCRWSRRRASVDCRCARPPRTPARLLASRRFRALVSGSGDAILGCSATSPSAGDLRPCPSCPSSRTRWPDPATPGSRPSCGRRIEKTGTASRSG